MYGVTKFFTTFGSIMIVGHNADYGVKGIAAKMKIGRLNSSRENFTAKFNISNSFGHKNCRILGNQSLN